MIPDTAGALLAFLGLVAPGLVYQVRREAHRPPRAETAFREASRVGLTSLIFTACSLFAVTLWASAWSALPDVGRWLSHPSKYLAQHYAAVGLFLSLEVAIACLLAVLAERVTRTDSGEITDVSVWYSVLRRDVPPTAVRTWVWITTEDGVEFKGGLRAYTTEGDEAAFAIALGGQPLLRRAAGATSDEDWDRLDKFDAVVVPGASVRHLVVAYLSADGSSVTPVATPAAPTLVGRLRTVVLRIRGKDHPTPS